MATEAYLVKCDIRSLNHVFHKAIRQVILLNEKIIDTKERYERACNGNRKTIRYTTRLRLAAIEGTRNMYFEYARQKCGAIEELREELRSLTGEEYDFTDEASNFDNEQLYSNNTEVAC